MSDSTGGSSSTDNIIQDKDKLKILCLHGYRQNADTFKSKLGSFRKGSFNEIVHVKIPNIHPSTYSC